MTDNNFAGYGQKLYDMLIKCKLNTLFPIEGCSEDEIEMVRLRQKVDFLPQVYREFLGVMGRHGGDLFLGSDFSIRSVTTLKDDVIHDLKRFRRKFRVPKDAVIFLDHGGYADWYFHTEDRNDDPPVYLYSGEHDSAEKIADHLSEFLESSIREYAPNCQ